MPSPSRAHLPAAVAALLILGLGLEGCVATAIAGATLHVAGATVKTAAKVTGKAAGAAVHLATRGAGHHHDAPPPPTD
jgi:hypothetical protein